MTAFEHLPLSPQLISIRNTRDRITGRIIDIIFKIDKLKAAKENSSPRLLGPPSLRKEYPICGRNLRDELKSELHLLKNKMHSLKQETAIDEHRHVWKSNNRFQRNVDNIISNAQAQGYFREEEVKRIIVIAMEAINNGMNLLKAYPSLINMQILFENLNILVNYGWHQRMIAMYDEAWNVMAEAGTKIFNDAVKDFRNNPIVKNFTIYINIGQFVQEIGGETPETRPPKKKKKASFQVSVNGNKSNDTYHIAQAGDSLPSLSKEYYGAPNYWDIIYLNNPNEYNKTPKTWTYHSSYSLSMPILIMGKKILIP